MNLKISCVFQKSSPAPGTFYALVIAGYRPLFFSGQLGSGRVFNLRARVGSGLKVRVGPAFFGFRVFNTANLKLEQFFQLFKNKNALFPEKVQKTGVIMMHISCLVDVNVVPSVLAPLGLGHQQFTF